MKLGSLTKIVIPMYVSIYLVGCTFSYVPNVINTPQFKNKGEMQATIATGTAGWDPQFAYALTDNIGLMLNGSFANKINSASDFHQHNFGEVGLGFHQEENGWAAFSIYSGLGAGHLISKSNLNYVENYAFRFFIQPNYLIVSEVVETSLSLRGSILRTHGQIALQNDHVFQHDIFLEPVITAKIGPKYLKATFQVGFSLITTPVFIRTKDYVELEYQPFIFSAGLQAYLFRKYKPIKK